MNDPVLDRVSDGVLVHPFGQGAVAADLITGRAHLVNAAAAWLLTSDAASVDELVDDLPAQTRDEAAARIVDALDSLRTSGLVGRHEPLEVRPRPGGSTHEPPGSHVGRAHPVLAERIAFRSDNAAFIKRIDAFLGSGTDETPSLFFDVEMTGDDDSLDLFTEGEWHFLSKAQLFSQLPAVFNDYAVRSHDVIALHAGAVRTPDGRVVVLLGHMNAGKSTLTCALVQAGCDYFSDETIGIGQDQSLIGYPKPITIDPPAHAVLGMTGEPKPHIGPEELRAGAQRLIAAPHIDEILVMHFDPDVAGLQRAPVSSTDALESLCAHTLNLARMGQAGLATLCSVADQVSVSTFTHPGIDVAVPAIINTRNRP